MNSLFKNISEQDINNYLKSVNAQIKEYEQDSFVFIEGQTATSIFILKSGSVQVEKYDIDGKRIIMNRFTAPNTFFGGVYAFIDPAIYDYSCRAIKKSSILVIPKNAFSSNSLLKNSSENNYQIHLQVTQNLLTILANKAFFLNKKLLIFSSFNIRQKIATYLLQQPIQNTNIHLEFNRESLAEYLGIPRPSLSRELMKMQNDGLLTINKNNIIANISELENLI